MRSSRFILLASRRSRSPAACRAAVRACSPATRRRCGSSRSRCPRCCRPGAAPAARAVASPRRAQPLMAAADRSADADRASRAMEPATNSYALDSGDKLRVVVFGQEGLTASYAVDASGNITMPLIGAVRARGSTPAGLQQRDRRQAAQRLCARAACGGRGRGLSAVLHPRRGHPARPVSLCAEHDGRDRGRDRGRLHAARASSARSRSAARSTA